jgi:hypothetical protein
MGNALRETWRLLKPSILPRRGVLACILMLGAVAAFSLRAPFLLLDPLWNRVIASEGEPAAHGARALVQRWFEGVRESLVVPLFDLGPGAEAEKLSVLWTVGLAVAVIAVLGALAHYGLHCLSR